MRKTKKAIASLAIAGMVLSMAPLSVFGATTTNRLGGAGRVETAIQIAAQGWTASDSVIVVPADDANVVDALAAAPLAGQLNAPILVTYKGALDPQVQAEIVKLGAKNVYAVGALSADTVASLKAISGVTVTALQGADRTETAAKVAAQLTGVKGSFVVAYDGKADALSAASFAAANDYSIVIANPDGTIPASEKVVAPTYTVGGQVTVAGATPLAGADRYATNDAVVNGLTYQYDKVYVANGETLVDALAGAPLAAQTNSPIVLANATKAAAGVNDNLTTDSQVIALGGVGAVSESVLGQVAYKAPAVFGVESVKAINAKQLQVTFNKEIDKNTVISSDAPTSLVEITNVTGSDAITVGSMYAKLSSDKKVLTLTADAAEYFDGTYTLYLGEGVTTTDGEDLGKYVTNFVVDDQTAPSVNSIVYNAATNRIDVTMSEPVDTLPAVTVGNGSAKTLAANSDGTILSFVNTATKGSTITVNAAGAVDFNGNEQANSVSKSVAIEMSETPVQVQALEQKSSNKIKVVFDKAIAPEGVANGQDRADTLASAVTVLRGGSTVTDLAFTADSNDSTYRTYYIELNSIEAGPGYTFYDGNSSATVTVIFAEDGISDVFGNTNEEITKTLTMNKDIVGPKLSSSKLTSDKENFELRFDTDIRALSLDTSKISVRKDGVDATNDFTPSNPSAKVLNFAYVPTTDIPNGTYTIRLDSGAILDVDGNKNAAINATVTVSSTDSAVTVGDALKAGVYDTTTTGDMYIDYDTTVLDGLALADNEYAVAFSGKVGASALEPANYTLNGVALPSTTDIYFLDSTKQYVVIALDSNTMNYNSTTSVLRVSRVLDGDGNKVDAKNGNVAVVDNVKPTLVSATLNGNIVTLTFDEDMAVNGTLTATALNNEFEIKGGSLQLDDSAVISNVTVDGKKVIFSVSGGNWATVKAYSKITVKTLDNSTVVTDDTSANKIVKDIIVTVSKL